MSAIEIPASVILPEKSHVYQHGEGYARIWLYDPEIGKFRWKFLHRFVWEQANGQKVPRNCVIHHLDGDIDNNELENLQLMTRKDHSRLHRLHPELANEKCARYYQKHKDACKRAYLSKRDRKRAQAALGIANLPDPVCS